MNERKAFWQVKQTNKRLQSKETQVIVIDSLVVINFYLKSYIKR